MKGISWRSYLSSLAVDGLRILLSPEKMPDKGVGGMVKVIRPTQG
jgi:hypothetical protein